MAPDVRRDGFTALFAGGGTGGHLMPGISVAQEMLKRVPESRIVVAGTGRPLERKLVEDHGFEFMPLPSLQLPRSMVGAPRWMLSACKGFVAARRLLTRLRPRIVISLGGYGAVAPALAAALSDVPMVVMEQNAVPGKANRLLAWWAREVYVPWPGTEMSFPHDERVHVTGNPVRNDLDLGRNRKLAVRFGLNPHKRTLLVMGGSQGAQSVNEAILRALPQLEKESAWLQVLHSSGDSHIDAARAAYESCAITSAVLPYIDDMASAYALADLAVCRAGGTTLAELTALGVPSVLVPLPTATNDHQRRNAAVVAKEGGAVIIEQADITNGALGELVLSLLRDGPRLNAMRRACLRVGRPAATGNVVDRLMGVMQDRFSAAAYELSGLSSPTRRRA